MRRPMKLTLVSIHVSRLLNNLLENCHLCLAFKFGYTYISVTPESKLKFSVDGFETFFSTFSLKQWNLYSYWYICFYYLHVRASSYKKKWITFLIWQNIYSKCIFVYKWSCKFLAKRLHTSFTMKYFYYLYFYDNLKLKKILDNKQTSIDQERARL